MEAAARSLGATPAATLARVHVPLLAPSLATAALLVFVDVLKELPATFALRPFNFDTLAVEAYNLAKDERLAEAAAPSLAIVAAGLLPVIFVSRRYFQATRAEIFCEPGWFLPSTATFRASRLKSPSALSTGLSTLTLRTTGHSLLPSAK